MDGERERFQQNGIGNESEMKVIFIFAPLYLVLVYQYFCLFWDNSHTTSSSTSRFNYVNSQANVRDNIPIAFGHYMHAQKVSNALKRFLGQSERDYRIK